MGDLVTEQGTVIKRRGQRLLWALFVSDESKLSTNELVEELDAGQNQNILYQIDKYLGPDAEGFVHEVGKRRTWGPKPVSVWALTDDGEAFIEENIHDFEPPQTLNEALTEIRMLSDRLEELEAEMERWNGQFGWVHKRLDRVEEHLDVIESGVDEAREVYEDMLEDYEDLSDHYEDLSDGYEELDELTEDIVQSLKHVWTRTKPMVEEWESQD